MSVQEVAEWMIKQMGDSHWLYQETVVWKMKQKWGDEYVYLNENGNYAISKQVLKAFRKMTEDRLIWERGERAWRPRKPHEKGRQAE